MKPPFVTSCLMLGLGVVALSCRGATPPVDTRPNVLVFTMDTTRFDMLGIYGNKLDATPNIDRLAGTAVRFDRAYTVTPLTIPAHSSLHTGLYPPRHGVRDNGDFFLDEGALTLAEVLKGAGYETMASVGAEVTSHHWGFAQGFDTYFDDLGARSAGDNRWAVERPGDAVVDDALSWLTSQERGEGPWFAWIHMFDAHNPYEPREEFAEKLPGRPYMAEVAFVDAQVGRVITALQERGELDDTLVVVVSDHGEGFGDRGEAYHGMLLYNSTTRIPMVIRPPGGLPSARAVGTPTSLVDILPTALAAAGVPIPDNLDGIDLGPVLAAEPGDLPDGRDVYVESLYAWHNFGWAPQHALVDAGYKLIDSTTPEVYAWADAYDHLDLAPSEPTRLERMQASLDAKLAAMEPSESTSSRAQLSSERMAQLAALGYLTSSDTPADAPTEGLPDPVERLPTLKRVEAARAAFQEGRLEEAEADVRAVLVEDPGLMPPRQLLAEILRASGRMKEAVEVATEAAQMRESSQAEGMLGMLLMQSGRPRVAREHLEKALALDPYLATAWAPYLHLLYQSRDLETLVASLEVAKARLPDAPFVLSMEGAILVDQGAYELAEPLFVRALEADPRAPLAHYFLGTISARRGETALAEEEYLAELAAHPEAVPPRLKLVELYGSQRRYEEQLAQLAKLRELESPNPGNWFATGQALFNLERYDEAASEVAGCREQWPTYPHCAMLAANVLAKQGDREAAEVAYQEALRLAEPQEPPEPDAGTP